MDVLTKFGERLSELIFDNKLTVDKLSKDLNYNVFNIHHWLSGKMKYKPSTPNLVMLADYFKCSVDYLIGLDDENYNPNPIIPRPPFSAQFRSAVEVKGYNLNSLSKKIEMGTTSFYIWINGKSEPGVDSLLRIAKALDCSIDYLLGRGE